MIKNNYFKLFTTFGMMLFFGLSVMPIGKLRGYELGPIVLLMTALVCLLLQPKPKIQLQRPDKWLLFAGLFYVLASFIEVWLDNQPIRGYDHATRFILSLPIFFTLLAYPPKVKHFFMAATIGAILLGSSSLYYKLILGEPSSTMGLLSIQYACFGMVLAAISLSGIGYFYQGRHLIACLLCLLGSSLGVVAVFLSGSRGSWGSIFIMLALMFWVYRHVLKLKIMMLILVLLMSLCTSLYLTPQTTVQVRVNQAFSDIEKWQAENSHSSLGNRFVMWDNAIELGQKKWFLGWGAQGFMAEKERLRAEGEISKVVQRYDHPHNEFLNAWVKRGVPGVLALLLIYIVPILTFKQYLHQGYSMGLRSMALASISVPICFLIAGLTQTLLAHNSGVLFYVIAVTLCWTILRGAVNDQTTAKPTAR